MITATQAKELAQVVYPEHVVHGTLYGQPDEPVEVIFYQADPEEFYRSVYLHPYDGRVLQTRDHLTGFFAFILDGHMYLWLPENIGSWIVRYSILVFLLIIFTGLLLWFPKNWKRVRQRLTFQWKPSTRWRRKNFDLHTVTGFYIYVLAFVLAFTGSVISFPWFHNLVYYGVGGSKDPLFVVPDNTSGEVVATGDDVLPIDRLIPQLRPQYPDAVDFEIHYPHSDAASIYVEVSNQAGVYYNSDYLFFDQKTLEEVETTSIYGPYGNADFADMVIRMNYDIHVGAIGGIWGKILAFLASLVIASLPVTGFLIWWGRRNKKKPTARTRKPIPNRAVPVDA
jgi:uncharacterized iron-regulated membrane protein